MYRLRSGAWFLYRHCRDGIWLNGNRIRAYSLILFIMEIAFALVVAAGQRGLIVPYHHATTMDFSSFYAAGYLGLHGHPDLAYNVAAHTLTEQRIYGSPDVNHTFFFYPPVMLLLCVPLAIFPYLGAFYLWSVAQAALYIGTIRAIVGRGATLIPYVAFPSAVLAFAIGQDALLTAALFAAGTLLIDRRPLTAGALLGCLCYKPHFGLLIPIALIAGRHWRAFLSASGTVVALAAVSTLAFGGGIWPAYIHLFLTTAPETFAKGIVPYAGLVSPFAAILTLGGGTVAASMVQGACSVLSAVLVAIIWRRCQAPAPRALALIAGTMLAVPVILIYDLLPAAVCFAWMARDVRQTGWLTWEKCLIVVSFAIALSSRSLAIATHIPTGPVVAMGLLASAWRRAKLRGYA